MALSVVGFLEAVDVQGKDGERQAWDGAQGPIEFAPVLQAGERIGRRQRGEFHGRFVEGAFGANALEEATDVMAGYGDDVEHSSEGTLEGFAEDDQHAHNTPLGPDREG